MNLISATNRRSIASALAWVLLFSGIVACNPTLSNRGNIPLAEVIEQIEAGKQSRDEIVQMLGSPSTTATFGKDEVWYYIGKRTSKIAFLEPELLERKVLEIKFDSSGVVEKIRRYDASDSKEVDLVDRVTPTKGKELTILQQILGNVGRFSTGEEEN